jgi:AcrR family transcriptional regulator
MASTPKGAATRRKIVETAWALSDARGAEAMLAGVTLREIAAAADMTPSAVTYHFPTLQSLGLAMVEHLTDPETTTIPVEMVGELLDRWAEHGMVAAARMAAQVNWELLTSEPEVLFEQRFTRCYAVAATSPEVRQMMRQMVAAWIAELTEIYERTADRLQLSIVEPLELSEMAQAVAAMAEGLLHNWMCDPDSVRPELLADMVEALSSSLLVPSTRSVALAEVSSGLPMTTSTAAPDDGDAAAAAAVASLFAEGVAEVTLTEVARAMGCGPEEVAERFGSVDGVAALSFVRHVGRVAEAVDRRQEVTAAVRLTDGVYELTRCVQGDPHCAIALLQERQRSAILPATSSPGRAVGASMSFATALLPPLRALVDRPDADLAELAELIVDTSLGHGATHPRTPPGAITDVVLRLVPVGL